MTKPADIGLIGLAVMGQNLALNIAEHGHHVAVFNRTAERTEAFARRAEEEGFEITPAYDLESFVSAIARPRTIILMVQASAVDEQIDRLVPLLEPGDAIIDGGNANYHDTIRREGRLKVRDIEFLGVGISGGEEGARHGPAIMAGGPAGAIERVAPVFAAIAAKVEGEPCYAHVGADGAGHFVKMVHNGIEYADMQLIAESYLLLKDVAKLSYAKMQAVFARWNQGELDSYLIEITAAILGKHDPSTGQPMVEVILDRAGQKGTGAWSIKASLDYGAPAPTIAAAVYARTLSSLKEQRVLASERLEGPASSKAAIGPDFIDKLEAALLASKIAAYAQGFAIIDAAAATYGWSIDRAVLASIWRGGCIIRARFLRHIKSAYERDSGLPNLMLDPHFAGMLQQGQQAWREVVALAQQQGVAAPAFAASLAYYDSYRAKRLPANLLQAQRDYFGAHTFERIDRPGSFHHDWTR